MSDKVYFTNLQDPKEIKGFGVFIDEDGVHECMHKNGEIWVIKWSPDSFKDCKVTITARDG